MNPKYIEKVKIIGMILIILAIMIISYYCQIIYQIDIIYTHIYYLPIFLACYWWRYFGIAILLIILIIFFIIKNQVGIELTDFIRVLSLSFFTLVVSYLSNARYKLSVIKNQLIDDLQKAQNEIKTLEGILPICANCKKIRTENEKWVQIETYIRDKTDAEFSHGICPECVKKLYPELCD